MYYSLIFEIPLTQEIYERMLSVLFSNWANKGLKFLKDVKFELIWGLMTKFSEKLLKEF